MILAYKLCPAQKQFDRCASPFKRRYLHKFDLELDLSALTVPLRYGQADQQHHFHSIRRSIWTSVVRRVNQDDELWGQNACVFVLARTSC